MTNDFNSKDYDAWPLWLTLREVAQVLRYNDVGTVRLLTDKAVSLGGPLKQGRVEPGFGEMTLHYEALTFIGLKLKGFHIWNSDY